MARRKTGDKKITDKKNRAASREENIHHVQADDHSIAFDQLHVGGNVGGDIRIGHTIGYTAEQVSVLLKQITTTLQPKPFDGRSPYKGLDPEVSNFGNQAITRNIDVAPFPPSRSFFFSIDLGF